MMNRQFKQAAVAWTVLCFLTIGSVFILAQTEQTGSLMRYWIWRSSDMKLVSNDALLVLYQGNIDRQWQYQPMGVRPTKLEQSDVRLLLRIYQLGSPEDIANLYHHLKQDWAFFGVQIQGLEIDFDCASRTLSSYARWLSQLRLLLNDSISVTSLMTYIDDNPEGLLAVSEEVDFISMQLYADYHANPQFESVSNWLAQRRIRHTLGVTYAEDFNQVDNLCARYCLGINLFLNRKESI